MDSISIALIGKALDGLHLRQSYLSQNIANANTEGYQAIRVSFEDTLRSSASGQVTDIMKISPEISMRPNTDVSGEMRLDMELAEASQTSMRYASLIEVLGRQMSMTRSVVTGGSR